MKVTFVLSALTAFRPDAVAHYTEAASAATKCGYMLLVGLFASFEIIECLFHEGTAEECSI